jgi:ABC-type transport system involved in cytochrome bd biosynthesis fused ATPase/permease subunit
VVTVVGYLSGATVLGIVFAAFALVAAFLNGFFGLCLGCEAYLAMRRLGARRA